MFKGQPTPSTITPIRRAKISDGKSVRVTVPENSKVEAQTFALVEGFFGVAMQSVSTGSGETEEIVLNIEQAEYETQNVKIEDTYKVGSLLYYDVKATKFTTKEGNILNPNRVVGKITNVINSNDSIDFILLPQLKLIDQGEIE